MAYDNNPLLTLEEKKSVLRRAVERNWVVFFGHDAKLAGARVLRTDRGFKAGEAIGINGC